MAAAQTQLVDDRLVAAQARLAETQDKETALTKALGPIQSAAINAVINKRDFEFVVQLGLLAKNDPRFVTVCETSDTAVAQFREAEAACEHAKGEAIEASQVLEIERNRPTLEKRVQDAEAELERLRKKGERSGELPATLGEIAAVKWRLQKARESLTPTTAAI
ncbi:MAG: hypothetical protein HYR56_16935 [Acidobacteria bacterium]|nr:hypothetical protein [Acidobacteriota bacterium]MBI3428015.1 hypothetical protein [Acidobacteriota bacterium]